MHVDIEAAIIAWYEAAIPLYDAEWKRTKFTPKGQKDEFIIIATAEGEARKALYDAIEKILPRAEPEWEDETPPKRYA